MYHGEAAQEDFLVLSGECLLLIEGEERPLKAWDFVHFPQWTEHVIVGAGNGPCAILMVGSRADGRVAVPGFRACAEARRRRRRGDRRAAPRRTRPSRSGGPERVDDPGLPWR